MATEDRVPIPGTQRVVWPNSVKAGPLASQADAQLTAWLRPRAGGELDLARARALGATPPAQRTYVDRAALHASTTADDGDVALLKSYCSRYGIAVVAQHWRSVVLSGPVENLIAAFDATAAIYEAPGKRRFRHRSESLHAPAEIARILRGPFGLHEWPRSHAMGALPTQTQTVPISAAQIASRYSFPDGDGAGQTIAVLQLRGTFKPDDFAKCMADQGVCAKTPIVKLLDNAERGHRIETAKDLECAADTQIVGALAPGAQIVVYGAPDDERGVLDAVRTAVFDREYQPSILSISFGYPEYLWTPVALDILDELFAAAALVGTSVFCASGDKGAELQYDGKPHVLAPASSEFAHACGGTQIAAGASGTQAETGWASSGGGFSARAGVPAWQIDAAAAAAAYGVSAGRGVPDVAGQAMPGYPVFIEGTKFALGGTSAVAPMWSALAARLNARIGAPIGFFAPLLYGKAAGIFAPVPEGGNDLFRSAATWNPCTGLGVPIGEAIERMLRG